MKPAISQTQTSLSPSTQRRRTAGRLLKWLFVLPATLGLLAWGTTVAHAANILYNANLDITTTNNGQALAGPDGWTIVGNKTISGSFNDGADSEGFCNVCCANGYGLFFKPFQGSTNLVNDYVTVYFYQDNPATPGTQVTLSAYAACEANYCGLNPASPTKTLFVVEFLNASSAVISSNALDLVAAGMPTGGPASMALLTMPQVTAPAGTVTVRAGAFMINAYNTTVNPQNFFVDVFDLEAVAPPGSPVITNQPAQVTVAPGGTANFTVGVSSSTTVSYQWQHANTNISNGGHISGATSQTLTVLGVSTADVGHYRALVSNAAGSLYSQDATLATVTDNFFPVITLGGKIGDTYRIDYATSLAPTNWIALSTNKLTLSPQMIIDASSPGSNTRFYRAVFVH